MTRPDTYHRPSPYEIVPLSPQDSSAAAELHAESFPHAWSDGEFHTLLSQKMVDGFMALPVGLQNAAPAGFVLCRCAADEAEILTIAVRRQDRRAGLAWRLMGATIRKLKTDGCRILFLEVEEENLAAIGLYEKLGFMQIASRPAYYRDENGRRTTALVMRRDLG